MESKEKVNYLNFYQYNTPENTAQFLDAKFRQAQNDGLRMVYDVAKGIGSIFADNNTEKEWETFNEELRRRNEMTEYNLAKYKSGNGAVKNFALDFTGMAVRSFTSPFDFVTGKVNIAKKSVDIGVGIALNIGQYIYDEYSLNKRNVFNDFQASDLANMGVSALTTTTIGLMGANVPKVEGGEFLYKDNGNFKYKETFIDKMSEGDRQVFEILNSYGIYDTKKNTLNKVREVLDIFDKIYDLDSGDPRIKTFSKRLSELEPYAKLLSDHPEFISVIQKKDKLGENILSPKEFIDGFKEIKTNYKDYNKISLQATANGVLEELGINPSEVSNIRVRAKKDRMKYTSSTGINNYGETLWERNKYELLGEDVRITYEKDGDVYLVKSYIHENPEYNFDNHKVYRLGDTAPMDKLTDSVMKEETASVRTIKRMGYSHLIDMKNYNEMITRKRFGRPQDNYVNSVVMDYNNMVSYLNDLDITYKAENSKNYNATGKMDSNIKVEYNSIDAVQPIYKNLKMNVEQQMADDAQELFQKTGIVKPFGNTIYDYVNDELKMDKVEFIEKIQNKDFSGDNSGFLKIINDKINLYLKNRSDSKRDVNVEKAYYIDLFYNKQKTMTEVKTALDDAINGDFTKLNQLKEFVGKKVLLTEKEATSADLIWDNGKEVIKKELRFNDKLQEVELKEYSIDENPIEVLKALWHGIESTTKDAKKGGTGRDWQETHQLGMRFANDEDYGNFAAIFAGKENEIYEIISEVYSTNAAYAVGVDKLEAMINNLVADSRELSKEVITYKNIPGLITLNARFRNEVIKQLEGVESQIKAEISGKYKPNYTTDINTQRLNNGAIRKSLKSYLGAKFLGNFNFIREFPMNALKNVYGARKLGWKKKYGFLKSTVLDPIKVNYDLFTHCKKVKKGLSDSISDPVIRRRAELFMETRVANDSIYNNPKNYRNKIMKGIDTVGKNLAAGQTISDVHRKVNAEYMAINFLKDVFPKMKEYTSTMKAVLKSNGIGDAEIKSLNDRLSNMSDKELFNLVWNGKRATNFTDYQIQSLFEQFSDIMGREFQPFKNFKPVKDGLISGVVEDMMYLYKRYSLGALDNTLRNLLTYRDVDGIVRSRFSNIGESDFTSRIKTTFTGANIENVLDFGKAAVGTSILYTGIKWTHGKLSGSTEDERAAAKFDALINEGAIVSLTFDAVSDFFMDYTGVGIVLGSKTVIGGMIDTTKARWDRAWGDHKNPLSKPERLLWWFTASLATPEFIARGIDNIKLNKNISTRITTPSEDESRLWTYKYSLLAEIDQLERELPAEKIINSTIEGFGKAIDWIGFFLKNPEKAYQLTGSDKKVNQDAVIAGASAIAESMEEYSEIASMEEIFREQDPFVKEQQLKILGLDVDSQLSKMERIDRNTLNSILAFKGIRDEREILLIMQQLNHADNKKEFLEELLEENEMGAYKIFQERLKRQNKALKQAVSKRRNKNGINAYLETLDIANSYATGQMN